MYLNLWRRYDALYRVSAAVQMYTEVVTALERHPFNVGHIDLLGPYMLQRLRPAPSSHQRLGKSPPSFGFGGRWYR